MNDKDLLSIINHTSQNSNILTANISSNSLNNNTNSNLFKKRKFNEFNPHPNANPNANPNSSPMHPLKANNHVDFQSTKKIEKEEKIFEEVKKMNPNIQNAHNSSLNLKNNPPLQTNSNLVNINNPFLKTQKQQTLIQPKNSFSLPTFNLKDSFLRK
jgi:hypothetical protein